MSDSPGQQYFNQHVGFLMSNDLDSMISTQYADNAILISPFDVLDTPPPNIVQGHAKLKDFFRKWLDYHGPSNYESLYDFAETEDSISFHAIMNSQTGKWMLGEAWHIVGGFPNGKIDRHYGFAYKIS
jgi:hypothetical protein